MDPKSEKSDTEFPPSGKIGRTEKQLPGFTDIACDQDNPLKRLSQTLHKRNEDQEKAYTNVSDSKNFLEKTDFSVLPDTKTVLNKCSQLLFDIAPRAVDRVLLNRYEGSLQFLLSDLHELRIKFAEMGSYGLDEIDCLNIEEDFYKKDLNLSTKILLLLGHRGWYYISKYKKFRITEDSETGVEDDLLKIQYYYNWLLCVNKQNLAKTELCFMWNLITKAVVRIGESEFKTQIENIASSQTCDLFKIPDKHTEKSVNNQRAPAVNESLKHDHSKIHEASMFGHSDEVKELLQNGADVNERNNAGESALYVSAKHGYLDVVKELLQNGVDTNKCNHKGETPLYVSAEHGHLDVVKELLQNGADTNKCRNTRETPLYISAKHGHLDVVKEFLHKVADTNECKSTGGTPLYVSEKHGPPDVVKELLHKVADTNECKPTGETPLYVSENHSPLDVVEELLKNGVDTNKCNYKEETPLYVSAEHGHLDVVKELLQNGADTNKCKNTGESSLYISAKYGHLDVGKELLQNGADTNECKPTGETPLYVSAKNRHLDVVKELLQKGADTNKCSYTEETPLYVSAEHGHLDVVKELLQKGADTNKRNQAGETPLYVSAKNRHLDVVKELLQNGADTNKRTNTGQTPLYVSSKNRHLDVVKELLQNGADTNKCNHKGETPLYVSAELGHLDVVKELLQNGADTNKCRNTRETPLYVSAEHGHLDVVQELLQNGADTNKRNRAGELPLCIASQHDHHDVVIALLEYGAERNTTYNKGKSPSFASSNYKKDKAIDDNYEADVNINVSNVEKSVLKQTPRLKGGLTCDQSEIDRIQKIFKKIEISVLVSNRQFVVPPGKMSHIYFVHSSDPIDTLWVETTIKTIENHGFKCCRGLSKIMNEQSFEIIKTDFCLLCLVLTRCFMEEASRECIELLKSQRCEVLVIQLSENKDTDFQFENLTKINALGFWEEHIEWFQELLKYLKNTDLNNVNIIANEKFNCNPSTAFRVKSSIADAEPIDILILTDQIEKPIITKLLENRVKITNPKLVSKESDVIISKSEHVKQLTREQMTTAKEIIQANSDQLFKKHRNLNIITSSNVRSKQGGEEIINEPCIVLYCYCKGLIPEEESDFPIFLKWETHQLPVDVREGFFEFGGRYNTDASTNYHEKVKIGCGIGILNTKLEGTVGPFLKCYGGVGFLTCAHVTCGLKTENYHYKHRTLNGDFRYGQSCIVLQPPPNTFKSSAHVLNTEESAVGEVYEAVFKPTCQRTDEASIDVSIVKITNGKRIPKSGEFAVISQSNLNSANFVELPIFEGNVIKDPKKIDTDARIVKFGMTTHGSRGKINSNGTVVRSIIGSLRSADQTSFVFTFQNQYEVGSKSTCPIFFQGGDSGSGVFQVEKQGDKEILHLIGLAIGFTSYHSAIVTPIKDIMEALQIDDDAFKL